MKDSKIKREAAVDLFATAIKKRINDKAAEGKRGWDGKYPTYKLVSEIFQDSGYVLKYATAGRIFKGREFIDKYMEALVDIGARAMMLFYRVDK